MPILGFSPGVPTITPNICTDVSNFIPFEAGMEGAPSQYDIGAEALAAACTGAVTVSKIDGTKRTFAATDTKIYELGSTTWSDRKTLTTGGLCSFCQFGDATIASNNIDILQTSSSTTFADISGAPKAKIVESVVTGGGGFVFACNTYDTGNGRQEDRWWCSGINDSTAWTASTTTQCTTGRLLGGGGGPITAAKRFGADSIVIYKSDSLYHGRYVGSDVVWQFQEIPKVGCVGMRAVENLGYAHFIVAQDGFWLYDGARPVQIGTAEVRQWFASNINSAYLSTVEVVFDKDNNRIWIFFPYSGSTTLNKALVYHLGTQQWGLADVDVGTTLFYIGSGVTIDSMAGTIDSQVIPFNSPLWTTATRSLAAINGSKKLTTFTGTPGASYFFTSDMGDVSRASRLTEAYAVYQARPSSAVCSAFASAVLGGTELVGPTQTATDTSTSNTPGRFTLRQHARYHRLKFAFSGPVKVVGYTAKISPAGAR